MHYKMSDVVREISERENNPSNSQYDRFVGLEHYESGELEIKKYGSTDKLASAVKIFHSGDILIARRNVYLRRASVVRFDGVTSGDSIVLRANNERIGRLLPFIFNTDAFWNFADQFADGTMSKRLSPKTLMQYEFDLPDENKLDALAELLWSAVETRDAYYDLLSKTDDLVKSQFIEMFGDPVSNPKGWEIKPLLTMGSCKNGLNYHSNDSGVEVNCLGVGDFKNYDAITDTQTLPKVSLNELPSEDYLLKDGDIVFVRSNGNKTMVGRSVVVYPHENPTIFSGFCIRYRNADDSVLIPYLLKTLKMDSMRKRMYGRGANIQNLNQQTLASLNIPVPPTELQQRYVDFIEQVDKSKFELKRAIENITLMIKTIMQQNFSDTE